VVCNHLHVEYHQNILLLLKFRQRHNSPTCFGPKFYTYVSATTLDIDESIRTPVSSL
jgi:hypothetical protein